MFRLIQVLFLLVKYYVLHILARYGFVTIRREKLLRKFFEEAGGSFIKFGQLLSLRVDVLSKEAALELINLFDNVKPFPYKEVESIFLRELGATPQKVFEDFQREPFASASFGQVHAAKLTDGTIVAVKVMRPGIDQRITSDFFIVDLFSILLEWFFRIPGFSWREFTYEFKKWTRLELDYYKEAANGERMYKHYVDNKRIVIPKTYHNLTTKRILVTGYVDGIPLSRILRGLKDGRLTPDSLKEKYGIDLHKAPRIIAEEMLNQYFFYHFFHADPHPGNIILLRDGKIAFIDFGIIGNALPGNKESFAKLLKHAGDLEVKEATYHAANFVGTELRQTIRSAFPATINQERINEFIEALATHFSGTVGKIIAEGTPDLFAMKKDYAVMLFEIMRAADKYKLRMPKEAVLMIRTLAITGFLSKEMDKTFRLQLEIQAFFKKHTIDSLLEKDPYIMDVPEKRISRELAIEKLNGWLSYLVEVDPSLYQLVKKRVSKYNFIDK